LPVARRTGPALEEAIVGHPGIGMLTFTGSTAAGKRVGGLAARNVARPLASQRQWKRVNSYA
jgi:aldehyde dehydrogenase (NAD+)